MGITDDPIRDAYLFDMEEEERINRLPVCTVCGEHIQDEDLIHIEGKFYHEDCFIDEAYKLADLYKRKTRRYIKGDI